MLIVIKKRFSSFPRSRSSMQSKAMIFELPVILSMADWELISPEKPPGLSNHDIKPIYLEDVVSVLDDDEAENSRIISVNSVRVKSLTFLLCNFGKVPFCYHVMQKVGSALSPFKARDAYQSSVLCRRCFRCII
jgi:hypothetical protein